MMVYRLYKMSVELRKRAFPNLILIISGVLIVFVVPGFVSIPTGCLYNKITGFYCAGCGISRGIHALLRGDISRAAQQNILIVTAFPLSALWFSLRSLQFKQFRNIKSYDKIVIIFLYP